MEREWNRQIKRLEKKENRILSKKPSFLQTKVEPIINTIQEKIPDKLQATLEGAFFKGFQLVFEKGSMYIEKTYNKDKHKLEHDLNNYAIDKVFHKRYMKRMDKQANLSQGINSAVTVLEGGVLGFLGIGLPDIPLFIAMVMRTIYEIALSYGYDYENDREKIYILHIICGAMTRGEEQKAFNERINQLGSQSSQQSQIEISLEDCVRSAARILSDGMLSAKFIQGIPVAGVVGGVVNYQIIRKIGKYAKIKYKKRYLLSKAKDKLLQS